MEMILDNSAFSLLCCDYKFQNRVVRGIQEPSSAPASFGDAVHKVLEYQDRGMPHTEIIKTLHNNLQGVDVPKAITTVTFLKAAIKMPPPIILIDSRPAIEVKFKHKYASFLLPGQSELLDIYLAGTIDRIYMDGETLVICDYKNTQAGTAYSVDKILDSYTLSFQLPFYFYALLNFNILPASYVDLLKSRQYRMEIILICPNTSPPSFKRYIKNAFPDPFVTNEIPLIVNSKIQQALAIANLTTQAPKTGFTVYNACPNCGFRPACLSAGTAKEAEIISSFPVKPYNPLTFR